MHLTREEQELLEAYGFDLMAQVEALLRHVREYQRALQRFRGTLPPQNAESPLAIMARHVGSLRQAVTQFDVCLTDVEDRTRVPDNADKPGGLPVD